MAHPPTPDPGMPPLADIDIVREALDDRYEILSELGRGGMAVVYEARERALDRVVALKVLPFGVVHDESFVARFEREARTAAQLEHAHIIPVYGVGRAGRVIYFSMKLVRGLALSDRLRQRGPLSVAHLCRVLTEVASALGYAHRRGVVHRDVKPDNILFGDGGRSVVTDFGIARSAAEGTLTAAGTSVGTPRYMSPEQARAQPVDGRSDIYSLGVVGYECLTGRVPFDGDDMMAVLLAHVTSPLPVPANLADEQRFLYAVIERMLAKAPDQRYRDADEVIAALAAVSTAAAIAAASPPPATATPSRFGPAALATWLRQRAATKEDR